MDPNKKRLVEDHEFVELDIDIARPATGKTGAFSAKKHRYYTVKRLEGGFSNPTPRVRYLLEKIAEISKQTGEAVPYAFSDRSGNKWSIDAGCLDAIGPRYQKLVKFQVRDGYIVGIIPGPELLDASGRDSGDDLAQDLEDISRDDALSATERDALISARIGQGRFRREVLALWGSSCAVTGSRIAEIIRASHILPWRDSNNDQRLDAENGLPLVATLDALFDRGIISFGSTGKLLINKKRLADEDYHLNGYQRLRMKPYKRMAAFLAEHRKKHGFKDRL